jgi:hypothetical protein
MTSEEIEKARLDIERERLELDRTKSELDKSFFKRNSGVLIPAAVSLAAVIVSLSQVWITKISKEKELEITTIQKKYELNMLEVQKKREWDLSAAKFVIDNRQAIFNGSLEEQRLFAKIIPTIFPEDISASLLTRIETASPPASKAPWREALNNTARPSTSARSVPTSPQQPRSLPQPERSVGQSSSDKRYAVEVTPEGRAVIRDTESKLTVATLDSNNDPIVGASITPDGRFVKVQTISGSSQLWELGSMRRVQ